MAISNVEFWTKSTDQEKEQIVKEGLSKVDNFEDSTTYLIKEISEKGSDWDSLKRINEECLQYIQRFKNKKIS